MIKLCFTIPKDGNTFDNGKILKSEEKMVNCIKNKGLSFTEEPIHKLYTEY